ncbi:hypothetical protein F2Q69_00046482 [Brassica cretica]|uniref:Uncharacterized protein n=1 Tax=Brassica cretica TaxID=69181 RepID=A0A8S9PV35_BRACR|nr:hypothetical protein F2Q69_00046482 [Brassica cretica]
MISAFFLSQPPETPASTTNSNRKLNWLEFVAVATGENGEGYIRAVKGLDTFTGQIVHSSRYKPGHE